MGNRTFFKKAMVGEMKLKDIFSEVLKKHTPEEAAEVFIGGTALTTPKEEEMLARWKKPFLFARFFVAFFALIVSGWIIYQFLGQLAGMYTMLAALPFLIPVTIMILTWEMHVPRNMSLVEVFKIMGIGGILSIAAALVLFNNVEVASIWAGLIEEPAKLLVVYLILKNKKKIYILDGVLVGMAVGTGFAVFETLMYTFNTFGEAICYYIVQLSQQGVLGNYSTGQILYASGGDALHVALSRAFNAVAGHGLYAALYGGGLAMAAGNATLKVSHLLHKSFLKYFVISIALHAYNNSGITFGLPTLFGGIIYSHLVLLNIVAVIILLSVLKIGVNQIVRICADENSGRVTLAVNRKVNVFNSVSENQESVSSAEMYLSGISGPYMGKSYPIAPGQKKVIGRVEEKSDIAVPSCASVSGTHCEVSVVGSEVYLKDLNSTNGTYLGEQKLYSGQEVKVMDGSIFYLGNKDCGFKVIIR